jgi:hypothetical protein
VPNHRVSGCGIVVLGSGEQVITTAGKRCLVVASSLGGSQHTPQQKDMLAVLGCAQLAHGIGFAALGCKRIEQILGQLVISEVHMASRFAR